MWPFVLGLPEARYAHRRTCAHLDNHTNPLGRARECRVSLTVHPSLVISLMCSPLLSPMTAYPEVRAACGPQSPVQPEGAQTGLPCTPTKAQPHPCLSPGLAGQPVSPTDSLEQWFSGWQDLRPAWTWV
jgi:hypothetical protein